MGCGAVMAALRDPRLRSMPILLSERLTRPPCHFWTLAKNCPRTASAIGAATRGYASADRPRPERRRFQPAGPGLCIPREPPHAHARVAMIDTAASSGMPGVLAVLTGSDAAADGRSHPAQPGVDEPARGAAAEPRRRGVLHRTAPGARGRCRALCRRTGRSRRRGNLIAGNGRCRARQYGL